MSSEEYRLGYAIERENHEQLWDDGEPIEQMMRAVKESSIPPFNPRSYTLDVFKIRNQGSVGACQGFALASCLEVCLYQLTGRIYRMSAMGAYIWSQQEDGLLREGDVGSTLSGGNKAAKKGLCLESIWPYTGQYSRNIPSGAEQARIFNLVASQPITDVAKAKEWMESGWPVQTGITWADSDMNKPVVDTYYGPARSGGHSTFLWGIDPVNGMAINHNSWGQWQKNGTQLWSWNALDAMIRWRGSRGERNTFIAYRPDFSQQYPTPDVAVSAA